MKPIPPLKVEKCYDMAVKAFIFSANTTPSHPLLLLLIGSSIHIVQSSLPF